ncbi:MULTISPECIES: hypothetical protein [Leptolyngbya]|uniref:hypothetical protein n=1 Tax=Leptolyngbya TaxID=47251 RepID=UPI00168588DD|nr:hypothetical protein [Leptolyngbya sp. FACHB-1624]MBD1855581.1 hypothetical protein [Leptolyngbya sp. FACHB-1624]
MQFLEKDVQAYIWNNRKCWRKLIQPLHLPKKHQFLDDLSDVKPELLLHNQVLERVNKVYEMVKSIELLGYEVPLEKASDSTIRADFLGTLEHKTGIAIIELKRSHQTEREAFTELLAYSNHLIGCFPGMCKEDIIYVLISPMKTRIAREAYIQTLITDNKPILALIPELSGNAISSLKLSPWIPSVEDAISFTDIVLQPKNFNVCKIAWEHSEGNWNPSPGQRVSQTVKDQLNWIAVMAAKLMEQQGIHGFAYCSQIWSELSEAFPFTNSLILAGLNPYAAASQRYLGNREQVKDIALHQFNRVNMKNIIPGLKEVSSDLFRMLYASWDNHLFNIAIKVVEDATKTITGKSPSIDWGAMTWEEYKFHSNEDIYCTNYPVYTTGYLRELYWDFIRLDYDFVSKVGTQNHPVNFHDDLYLNAVETIHNENYFRRFIDRFL